MCASIAIGPGAWSGWRVGAAVPALLNAVGGRCMLHTERSLQPTSSQAPALASAQEPGVRSHWPVERAHVQNAAAPYSRYVRGRGMLHERWRGQRAPDSALEPV
jgi:hypothetical protein